MRSFPKALLLLTLAFVAAASASAQSFEPKTVKDLKSELPGFTFDFFSSFDDKALDATMVDDAWIVDRHEPETLPPPTGHTAKIFLRGDGLIGTTVGDAIEAAKAHNAHLRLWLESADGSRRRASDPMVYKDQPIIEKETEVESGKRVSLGKRVSVVAKAPSGIVLKTGGPAWEEFFVAGMFTGVILGIGIGLVLASNRRRQGLL